MLTADVTAIDVVDGTGRPDPEGSYVRIHIRPHGLEEGRSFRVSKGATELLMAELHGLLGNDK